MKQGKKVLSVLLVVVLLLGCLPMGASMKASAATQADIVRSAINSYVSSSKGTWGSSYSGRAWGCFALCNYVWKNVFGYDTYAGSSVVTVTTSESKVGGNNLYNFLKNNGAKAGDLLFMHNPCHGSSFTINHTMVIMNYDSTGIWLTDGYESNGKIVLWDNNAKIAYTGTSHAKYFSGNCYPTLYKINTSIWNSVKDSTPHTHSWVHGIITTAPTETSTGIRTFTCEGCGATTTEVVPKLPHTHKWDSGKVTEQANTVRTGKIVYTCTGCGQTKTEIIPKVMQVNGKCGDNVTWSYDGTTKTLTLSGTGPTYDYNPDYTAPWHTWNGLGDSILVVEAIEHIVVSPGITTIGDYLFSVCQYATSISIPQSVNSIGKFAFDDCYSLESITIPSGKIGDHAFFCCDKLKRIQLNEGVTEIGSGAFGVFSSIRETCAIESISIPSTVTKIGPTIFYDRHDVKSINLSENNRNFSICDGVIYNKNQTELVYYLPGNSAESFTVPSTVTLIKKSAFAIDESFCLKEITIPQNVKSLEENAFQNKYSGTPVEIYFTGTEQEWSTLNFTSKGYNVHCAEENRDFGNGDPTTEQKNTIAGFSDVFEGDYYADSVKWAVEKKITSGTSATKFSPNSGCTRGQAVTFLWRAAGEPEPQNSETAFTDVKAGDYYEKAVRWAVEKGITSGTSATKFSPGATCTRAQIVTFLWRAQGSPAASGNSFSDVKAGEYYESAVSWAVGQEITAGTSAGKFSPGSNCTRGQIVTFLYRYSS